MLENKRLSSFQNYLSGLGCSAVAMGLQIVIFPWLVVGVLHEPADRVGLAQMAVMLPNLLFILLGGAVSDNRHLGSYLFLLYLLYLVPFSMMFVAVNSGLLSYELLILFGVSYGVITAFVQPARESLLPQVCNDNLQLSVVRTTLVQFGAQSLGYLSASQFDRIGLNLLLVIQMVMLVAAGLFLRASQPTGAGPAKGRLKRRQSILSGLQAVRNHARLLPLMLLVGATGFLGFGAYLVAIPLMTREVYAASAVFYAGLQLSFTAGVLVSNGLYLRLSGGFRQPGKILLISLFCRGLVLLLLATKLPVMLLFPTVMMWGMFSGISISLGRVMTHTEAPEAYRSRVISIYQLSFFGMAPIGAWVTGQMIDANGVLQTFSVIGALTLLVSSLGVFTQLWRSPGETRAKLQ